MAIHYPMIIQGGMGVAVSNWELARAVSLHGELGVVSGTALAMVLVRRLQAGDSDGAMRRALAHFPVPEAAARVLATYFRPGGRPPGAPFALSPLPSLQPGQALTELTVVAGFAEVFLAKENHDGLVGMNLLEKIQLPTLPTLFGAMLADVDYVLMGAGIPRAIPGILDRLAAGELAEMRLDVAGALPGDDFTARLDPRVFLGGSRRALRRPTFLAIVSSATLAMTLARKSSGRVDGFVVEGNLAGGHNAPPRGVLQLDALGQPIYGLRDQPALEKFRELGLPFWLAGSYARPDRLAEARRAGAAGIQVGTAFAFCRESGAAPEWKRAVIRAIRGGLARVFTDPVASPTGFPFKIAAVPGTLSEPAIYAARKRICDLGFLRELYRKIDGSLGYRCGSEPVADFLRKGGELAQTIGRKCLCNGLAATVGLGQTRDGEIEPALVTAGDELADLAPLFRAGDDSYTAADVLRYIRGVVTATTGLPAVREAI